MLQTYLKVSSSVGSVSRRDDAYLHRHVVLPVCPLGLQLMPVKQLAMFRKERREVRGKAVTSDAL